MLSGLRTASLYGIHPQELGFCGPRRSRFATLRGKPTKNSVHNQLYNFILGKKISQKKIRKILEAFKGTFFYYKLIAKSNKITNPFNENVVKAYWVGNNLLEKVKTEDLRKMIARDFSRPGLLSKIVAFKKSKELPENSKPHHSFHVLVIGSVTGRINLKGKLLDLCRVGWGKVINQLAINNLAINNKQLTKIIVKYQPLVRDKVLKLGKPIEKEIFCDKKIVPNIKIGDWISFHWNNAVQILNKSEVNNLNKYTNLTLKLLKNSLKPSSENLTAISN
jgi:hypothetical protein